MGWKYNRKHLHAVMTATYLFAFAMGWWVGFRAPKSPPWYEFFVVMFGLMFVQYFVFASIDKKYLPPEG